MPGPHGITTAIDIDGLHALLYRRSGRLKKMKLVQRHLADELGVTSFTMNRIIRQMESEGRLRKVGTAVLNVHTYAVIDPAEWVAG